MKKQKDYTVLLLIICFVLALLGSMVGCKESKQVQSRDYQIELFNDTVWVFDGERLVSKYITNWNEKIDTVFMNDNR